MNDPTTPMPLIPARPDEDALTAPSVAERLDRALDAVGRPLTRPAGAWKREADRRTAARSDENRAALLEANRAYRDAMRDVRRDAKAYEKARDEVKWWNIANRERRAARIVLRDTKALAAESRNARREAARAYPLSLPGLAARCHAAHLVPVAVWDAVADSATSAAFLGLSLATVVANLAVTTLGMRHVAATPVDDGLNGLTPSQAERELLQRLEPKTWHGVAEPRGLADVVAAGATLTGSGIQVKLTLNGTMDVPTLRKREPQLRAALRVREGTRIEIREGKTGGHARLTIRTRSKADGLDLTGWKPGDAWAVNTVTGEPLPVPLGKRLLIAGTSGSGKSWSARPLMAEASEWDDHRLVIFDRKYIEGRNWEHRARIVTELDEMDELCDELSEEGEERLKMIPRGRDTVDISPSRPRITVFVDEGGELIQDCKGEYERIMDRLRKVARKYRAAEIILVWATQKPTMTGLGHGIDSQIAGQLPNRLCLAVTSSTESRTVFGDDSGADGWDAHKLPMPGFALLKNIDEGPACLAQMLKMRAMSPAQVIALPDRPVWSRTVSSTGATAADIAARVALEKAAPDDDPWSDVDTTDAVTVPMSRKPRVSAEDRDDQIMSELNEDPCRTLSDLARATGASKSVVKKRLAVLEEAGLVVADEDGCWHPVP